MPRSFLHNFWRVSFFQFLNSASAFLINLWVARLVGPAVFGNFYFFVSTALIATIFFDFGLSRTLLRFSAFHMARGEMQAKLGYYRAVLRLKSALGLVLLAAGAAVAWRWGGELRWPLLAGLVTGFLVSYNNYLAIVAQTEEDYASYNLLLSFNTLRLAGVGVLAACCAVFHPVLLYGLFMAAPLLLAAWPALRLGRDLAAGPRHVEAGFYRKLLQFGKWLILLSMLETIYQRLDVILVRLLTSAQEAGYYSGALAFFGVVYLLPSYSAILVYPKFVQAISQNRRDQLSGYYRFSTDLMAVIAIPLALGLWAIGPDLVATVLGPAYAPSLPLFKYLAAYALILGCHLNSGGLFFAQDRPQTVCVIAGSFLVTTLLGILLLLPGMGITGAGLAIALGAVVSLVLSWGLIRGLFGLFPDFRHLAVYLTAGAVMAATVRLTPWSGWIGLILEIAVGAGVYTSLVWAGDRLWNGVIPRSRALEGG